MSVVSAAQQCVTSKVRVWCTGWLVHHVPAVISRSTEVCEAAAKARLNARVLVELHVFAEQQADTGSRQLQVLYDNSPVTQ